VFVVDIERYKGGIALWGAVPPVYDTTTQPLDRGVHVHARRTANSEKVVDATFRAVRLVGRAAPAAGVIISELDAIYYMVTSLFGYQVKLVSCTHCGYDHLDKDWFSVHPHRRHLCAGCGKQFRDTEVGIGNPVCRIRTSLSIPSRKPKPAAKTLDLRQRDYPGGIQIWGSNPAILWTRREDEQAGIHVHAFRSAEGKPVIDDTFAQVTVDGVRLAAGMVRTLMAQSALPHIENRVIALRCPRCHAPKFSAGQAAITPVAEHACARCGHRFGSFIRLRKTISNPLVESLRALATHAPRPPQKHALGLLPETL